MFIRHFYPASEIFSVTPVGSQKDMPEFCDLRVTRKSLGTAEGIVGCGLYFFMHKGKLIYIGKFMGTIHDAFGGDIFAARWNRHISTLSLRGSRISISEANLARAMAEGLHQDLESALQITEKQKLAKDRGFMVPYKRLKYAAMYWDEFSGPAESWLSDIEVGYVQLDPTQNQLSTAGLRWKVSNAEKLAIQQVPTILNGRGEFEKVLLENLVSDDAFELLESVLGSAASKLVKLEDCIESEPTEEAVKGKGTHVDLESDYFGEQFLELLPSGCPEDTALAIYERFSDLPELQIHHTKTNGGDLRIRTLSPLKKRIFFTMYWQTQLELFCCRILLSPNSVEGSGISKVQQSTLDEPLPTTFKVDCTQLGAIDNLMRLIQRSIPVE